MVHRPTTELIALLRKTLIDVQEGIWRETPAIKEMKRSILRAIAELEADLKPDIKPKPSKPV
jgi:hypothetical protein